MRFLSTVCLAAICMAFFRLLIPEDKFQKQMALLMSAVFLLTAVSAFGNIEIDLKEDSFELGADPGYISFSEEVNGDLKKRICDNMREKVEGLLAEHEICPEEIHIIVNISGLYSIDITQVELVFHAEERAAAEVAAGILSRELPQSIAVKTVLR